MMRYRVIRVWRSIRVATVVMVAAIIAPMSVAAQTIAVQSGEHGTYTRLVLNIGASRDWNVTEAGATMRLTLSPPPQAYDLGDVYRLINRDRLKEIRADGDTLILELACPCELRPFIFQSDYLVLDIAPASEEQAVQIPEESPTSRAARATPRPLQPLFGDPFVPPNSYVAESFSLTPAQGSGGDRTSDDAMVLAQDAAEFIAEQIGRAAAAGLLDARQNAPLQYNDPTPISPPLAISASPPAPPLDQSPSLPIRAQTVLDPITDPNAIWNRLGQTALCPPEGEFDLTLWLRDVDFQSGIGPLSAAAINQNAQVDPIAARALAEFYLVHGFGAEAMYWMEAADLRLPVYQALAGLFEGHDGPHFDPPLDYAACTGPALMWRLLDREDLPHMGEAQIAAILRAYLALPLPLRDRVGPELARRLNARGADVAAREIRDNLARGARLTHSAQLLLDMDVGREAPLPQNALEAELQAMIGPDALRAADATARALTLALDAGNHPTPALRDLGHALLREIEGHPDQGNLWQAVLRAEAQEGNLVKLDEMLRAAGDAELPEYYSGLIAVIQGRADAGDAASVLYLMEAFGNGLSARPDARQMTRAVERLQMQLGLTGGEPDIRPVPRDAPPPSARPLPDLRQPEEMAGDVAALTELLDRSAAFRREMRDVLSPN
ncbi:hypothetical protein OE810_06300 [Rhodobacteraceae bacterium XHP0102]|nr:hypothetical protein [Rhodobacteraceae bacterium XHP0102]